MSSPLSGAVVHPYGLRASELKWINQNVPSRGGSISRTLTNSITHIVTRDATDDILLQILESQPDVQLLQLDEFKQLVESGGKIAGKSAAVSALAATTKKRPAAEPASKLVYESSSDDEAEEKVAKEPKYDGSKRRKLIDDDSGAREVHHAPVATPAKKPAVEANSAVEKVIPLSSVSLKWAQNGSLYYYSAAEMPGSPLVAAFDMDSTLIEPSSGKKFPAGRNDWRWWNPAVPEKLRELHSKGYKIIIFTNQGGVAKGNQKAGDLTGKIQDLVAQLKIPMQAFMASDKDCWRKPNTDMWEFFASKHNGGVKIDFSQSFFCGDAAGRVAGWKAGAKKDFSCSDRKFAHNVGLPFKLPEEFFLGQAAVANVKFIWDGIEPEKALEEAMAKSAATKLIIQKVLAAAKQPEMIIMVGCQGSGKSSFSKRQLVPLGYERVNRDQLKTQEKCHAVARQMLQNRKSVVVDNTNPDAATRASYIQIAKSLGVPVRCLVMTTPRPLAEHLNLVRERQTKGVDKRVPDIAYNLYFKKFEAPSTSEGFVSVTQLDWMPDFEDEQAKKLFLQFTE